MKPALLLLCHRIPYPPDKGDKIRSYHLLRYLGERYSVYLGAFVDDAEDWQHRPHLETLCEELKLVSLTPAIARMRSLKGFLTSEALSIPYYADRRLQRWVDGVAARADLRGAVAFSSTMAQYAVPLAQAGLRVVVDFVDVDSDKWRQYATTLPWWRGWLYRREARLLEAYEQRTAQQVSASTFVSNSEADTFRSGFGSNPVHVEGVPNGVDIDYFSPDPQRSSPFPEGCQAIVFTGVMDYWPNVDAVRWFVTEILPLVRARKPMTQFYIVGSNPVSAVRELASSHVIVTGRVPDVRPYLQHAAVVVAPMRIARGIQNKVLEGMAMGKAVVTTSLGFEGIAAATGTEISLADTAGCAADSILRLLSDPAVTSMLGSSARKRIECDYRWETVLDVFGMLLDETPATESN